MSLRRALPLLLAAALLPATGRAQPAEADRVRLDDFALPAGAPGPMQQVAPGSDPLPAAQPRDRSLALPTLPADSGTPLPQLSSANEGAPAPTQLAPAGRSAAAAPALSRPGDSRPEASMALTGKDRCDPQSRDSRERTRCRRILELRAAEFRALEAPVLSAEQRIIAAQQARERNQPLQPETGWRTSQNGTDPEDRSDQELAAIVLGTAPPPSREPALPVDPIEEQNALIDIMQAIGNGSAPPPN